jgi:threonine 3-dehydrogenase
MRALARCSGAADLGRGDGPIDDSTLQRPTFLYGATKLLGEHLGLFYRRKYGLDFRGLRYPGVVAPGVTTPGAAQYLSLLIEASAKGKPFTITVGPETRFPVMYVKDAARAIVELAAAPRDRVQTVTYLLAGMVPVPSAGELVALVRTRVPDAQIELRPDPALQRLIDPMARPLADNNARTEWGWRHRYGLEEMVDDFLQELRLHSKRYNSPTVHPERGSAADTLKNSLCGPELPRRALARCSGEALHGGGVKRTEKGASIS